MGFSFQSLYIGQYHDTHFYRRILVLGLPASAINGDRICSILCTDIIFTLMLYLFMSSKRRIKRSSLNPSYFHLITPDIIHFLVELAVIIKMGNVGTDLPSRIPYSKSLAPLMQSIDLKKLDREPICTLHPLPVEPD